LPHIFAEIRETAVHRKRGNQFVARRRRVYLSINSIKCLAQRTTASKTRL
jgi:hypothetical protein